MTLAKVPSPLARIVGGASDLIRHSCPADAVGKPKVSVHPWDDHGSGICSCFGNCLTDAIASAFIGLGKVDLWMPLIRGTAQAKAYLEAMDQQIVESPLVHTDALIGYPDYGQGPPDQKRYQQVYQKPLAHFGRSDPSSWVDRRQEPPACTDASGRSMLLTRNTYPPGGTTRITKDGAGSPSGTGPGTLFDTGSSDLR